MPDAVADVLRAKIRSRHYTLPDAAERRRIREGAGLSLADVAKACGTVASVVWHWERGDGPSLKYREAYGRALDVMREESR